MKKKRLFALLACALLALAGAAAVWLVGPPGGYSEAELRRLTEEIYREYARTADGEPVITHIGLGYKRVDASGVTGFGWSGREQRVVVGVIESRADEYRRLLLWKYGGRVYVESEERFASPS